MANNIERKRQAVTIDVELWKWVRREAVEREVTISEFVESIIREKREVLEENRVKKKRGLKKLPQK